MQIDHVRLVRCNLSVSHTLHNLTYLLGLIDLPITYGTPMIIKIIISGCAIIYGCFYLMILACFLGQVDYYNKHDELLRLANHALDDPYTKSRTLDVWYDSFITWVDDNFNDTSVSGRIDTGQ